MEDVAPKFNVHTEPKPGKDAKKALKDAASKLVRFVAQAVVKQWPGREILSDQLNDAAKDLPYAIVSAEYLDNTVRELVEWAESQYFRYKDLLPALHRPTDSNWYTLLRWHYDMLVSAREAKLSGMRVKLFTLLPLASLSSPPHITIDTHVLH